MVVWTRYDVVIFQLDLSESAARAQTIGFVTCIYNNSNIFTGSRVCDFEALLPVAKPPMFTGKPNAITGHGPTLLN